MQYKFERNASNTIFFGLQLNLMKIQIRIKLNQRKKVKKMLKEINTTQFIVSIMGRKVFSSLVSTFFPCYFNAAQTDYKQLFIYGFYMKFHFHFFIDVGRTLRVNVFEVMLTSIAQWDLSCRKSLKDFLFVIRFQLEKNNECRKLE